MGRACGRTVHRPWHHCNRNHLADSLKRYLLITRRRIPRDRIDEYARLWHALRDHAGSAAANAWLYRAQDSDDRFIEFLEWQGTDARLLTEEPAVADAIDALNTAFNAEDSHTWVEAKI